MYMTAVVILIVVISIIIGLVYHEYGHMKVAKKHGITVNKYVVGFGKPVIKWKGKDGTEYGITPFIAGGYCDINDEQLNSAKTSTYLSVMFAGVLRNLLIAFILLFVGIATLRGTLNVGQILSNMGTIINSILSSFGEILSLMFDVRGLAEQGGVITGFAAIGSDVTSVVAQPTSYYIGLAIIIGGIMNLVLALFNALPIPALDGGQALIRVVSDIWHQITKKTINKKLISGVNTFFFGLLLVLQAYYLLLDFEPFRQFVLNF